VAGGGRLGDGGGGERGGGIEREGHSGVLHNAFRKNTCNKFTENGVACYKLPQSKRTTENPRIYFFAKSQNLRVCLRPCTATAQPTRLVHV
jgi:hypothetical protein